MGGALGELLEHLHPQINPGLVGDGQQVQHQVGGAAHGHGQAHRVFQAGPVDHHAGAEALVHHLHDAPARGLGCAHTFGMHRRNGGAARQAHTQAFAHAAHGVGGAQKRTGAAGGHHLLFQAGKFLLVQLACCQHAQALGDRGDVGRAAVKVATAQGRAAGHQDSRQVQTGRAHEHAGHDLVAGAQHDQGVQAVGLGHYLQGVGDHFPRGKDVAHAHVTVGHPVAASDHPELNGGAAGLIDALLHVFGHLAQVVVAGNNVVVGVGHPYQGPLQVVVAVAHGLEQGPHLAPARPLQYVFAAPTHDIAPRRP